MPYDLEVHCEWQHKTEEWRLIAYVIAGTVILGEKTWFGPEAPHLYYSALAFWLAVSAREDARIAAEAKGELYPPVAPLDEELRDH